LFFIITLEIETTAPLEFEELSCYNDLVGQLRGELGLSLLSDINVLELLKNATKLLDELLSLEVLL